MAICVYPEQVQEKDIPVLVQSGEQAFISFGRAEEGLSHEKIRHSASHRYFAHTGKDTHRHTDTHTHTHRQTHTDRHDQKYQK